MTFHRCDSVILRIENYTAGRGAKRNWRYYWHHASSKTCAWLSEMRLRGNRRRETIIYTIFTENSGLAVRIWLHMMPLIHYSYSKCWHCGLYFWQSGTCVCILFFLPMPFWYCSDLPWTSLCRSVSETIKWYSAILVSAVSRISACNTWNCNVTAVF